MVSPGLANTAFVTNEKGNSVSVIDTDDDAGEEDRQGRAAAARRRAVEGRFALFVCAGDDDTIQIVDTKT